MRVDLGGAALDRLELEVVAGPSVGRLALGRVRRASGQLQRGPTGASLRKVAVDEATVARADWPFPGGRVTIDRETGIGQLACEGELGEGVAGRASARLVAGRAIGVEAGALHLRGDLTAHEVALEQAVVGGHASAATIEIGELEATLPGLGLRAAAAALGQARCDWGAGDTLVSIARAALDGAGLAADGIALDVPRAELPAGLMTSGGAVVIPELSIAELGLTFADFLALFAAGEPTRPRYAALEPPAGGLGFLDRIGGQLDVDMTAEIALPVVGSRRATHRFRVPIKDGIFNYKDLERDLASLEDAFIDIEVRGRQLAIERRIPLVPGSEKPLVLFDLDDGELELARKRFARLATIAKLRLPASSGDERGERSGPVSLARLDFAIDAALDLAAPADERPDHALRAAAGTVRIAGALRYAPGKALEPTRGTIAIERLTAGPAEQALGGVVLSFDALTCARVDIEATFDGFSPRAARVVARELSAKNVRLAARPLAD